MITKNNILELIKEQKKFDNKFSKLTIREFHSFSEKKKLYVSIQYINEFNKLNDIALLNEFINADTISKFTGGSGVAGGIANFLTSSALGSGVGQSILEWVIKSLLKNYLGIKDGNIVSFIVNFLLDDPATLMKSFTDCNVFTEKLVDALVETLLQKKVQPMIFNDSGVSGLFGDVLRNTVAEIIQNNETKKKIMQSLTPIVCKFISTAWDQLKNKFFG